MKNHEKSNWKLILALERIREDLRKLFISIDVLIGKQLMEEVLSKEDDTDVFFAVTIRVKPRHIKMLNQISHRCGSSIDEVLSGMITFCIDQDIHERLAEDKISKKQKGEERKGVP